VGEPPAHVEPAVTTLRSLDRLEQLAARVLKGTTWQEVLSQS
jgi:hypothetical protein